MVLEQGDYLIVAGIAFAVLWIYENYVKKKTYPPTFNDIENLEKKMDTRLDSLKNYDDNPLKNSISLDKVAIQSLMRQVNFLNHDMTVLKSKTVDNQPKPVMPPRQEKIKIPTETLKEIVDFLNANMSLSQISKRTGIPKTSLHRIVQQLKARSNGNGQTKTVERESYIG